MKNKLVSIVLPTYNGAKYLKEVLESIFSQTYQNWELIIVNDCSFDNTLEIANEYAAKDKRVKVLSNEVNQKTAQSLNNGFNLAKGEYFTWISDDNRFKPNALEYMVTFLENNPAVDFLSCTFDGIDENGNFKGGSDYYIGKERSVYKLLKHCNIGACFMYRKELAEKTGLYDKEFELANDYDYWMRAAIAGNIHYDETNLYEYRSHSGNLTSTRNDELWEETRKVIEKNAEALAAKLDMNLWLKINLLLDLYEKTGYKIYLDCAKKISPVLCFLMRIVRFLVQYRVDGRHSLICLFGIKLKTRRNI